MALKVRNLFTSAISLTALITALAPQLSQASEQTAESLIKPVTVYFTRNAEKKTTTAALGQAKNLYQFPDSDADPVGTAPIGGEEPKGSNRDDVCGSTTCAEELNDMGLLRSNLLASWLLQRRIVSTLDAVYTSHKYRTYQTVLPTATLADLDVTQLPPGTSELDPESTAPSVCATIEAITETPPGETILVAGHSDTLYDIMGDGNNDCTGLGLLSDDDPGSHRFPKDEQGRVRDYGDLWKVVIRNDSARFIYRVNLEATELTVIDRAR